jgi:hypothetical protein
MEAPKPRYSAVIDGKKLGLQFDVNSNPTKIGIKMQFILDQEYEDPRDKQELASKISTALQTRFGEAGVAISTDDRNPYKNVIAFIVPLSAVSLILMNILKGGK